MLKKLLIVPMLTLSTAANAGIFSGTLNVNPLLENLDVSGVTFDTLNFDPINSINTALSLFPDQINFDANLLNNNVSYSTLTPTISNDNRWTQFNRYEDNTFASFVNYGYECLQGTGIQVNSVEGYWQGSPGLESECYKTVNLFNFTFGELSIASNNGNNAGTPIHYNELQELDQNVNLNAATVDVRVEKRFYDTRIGTGGDVDDIMFSYAGILLLEQQLTNVSSLTYVTNTASTPTVSVPETSALALLALGLCGFGFTRKAKQQ